MRKEDVGEAGRVADEWMDEEAWRSEGAGVLGMMDMSGEHKVGTRRAHEDPVMREDIVEGLRPERGRDEIGQLHLLRAERP